MNNLASTFIKFTIAGGLSTGVHYVVLVVFCELLGGDPVTGSMLGYLSGAATNYYLNFRVTFELSTTHGRALPRFLVMVASGFALNASIMYTLELLSTFPYLFHQLAATGVVFLWNFVLSKLWIFTAYHTDEKDKEA